MSAERSDPSERGPQMTGRLRRRREAALALPHPDETWTVGDVAPPLKRSIHAFAEFDIIEHVDDVNDYEYEQPTHGDTRHVWRTTEPAWRFVTAYFDGERPGPCDHSGVRNCGDHYECTEPTCDATFGRDIARERLEGR